MDNKNTQQNKVRTPLLKQWWLWVILVIVVIPTTTVALVESSKDKNTVSLDEVMQDSERINSLLDRQDKISEAREQLNQLEKDFEEMTTAREAKGLQEELDTPADEENEQYEAPSIGNNPIGEMDDAEVAEAIKTNAEKTWGTDYDMVEYEIKVQTEAYNNLKSLELEDYQIDALYDAMEIWDSNFDMIEYEYEIQMESYDNLYK